MAETMSPLLQEIREQPQVIQHLLQTEAGRVSEVAGRIRDRGIEFIFIAARGTSDNAATYAKYLFGAINHLPVALAAPSLFTLYKSPPRLAQALVMGISQSGQSPDIVAVLRQARRQGALTVAITNEGDSPLARAAEYTLLCRAGEEKSVAATKTYTTQLALLALLSAELNGEESMLKELRALPSHLEKILSLDEGIREYSQRYRYAERFVIIGRGYNYATALEIALKLKETSHIVAEPYSAADFWHGPIAMVERDLPVIMIAPRGSTLVDMQRLAKKVGSQGAELMIISDDEKMLELAHLPLKVPVSVPEVFSPVPYVMAGQLLAYHVACIKGYDPAHPRGLRKITLTR